MSLGHCLPTLPPQIGGWLGPALIGRNGSHKPEAEDFLECPPSVRADTHVDPSLIAAYATIGRHVAGYGFSKVTAAKVTHLPQHLQRGLFPQTMVEQHIAGLLRIRLKEACEAMSEEVGEKR